jgi:hypothetical protein
LQPKLVKQQAWCSNDDEEERITNESGLLAVGQDGGGLFAGSLLLRRLHKEQKAAEEFWRVFNDV